MFLSPSQRSPEDLEVIYEELLHVKAVAHLSTSVSQMTRFMFICGTKYHASNITSILRSFPQVRKELAAVLVFESNAKAGTVCECESNDENFVSGGRKEKTALRLN